MRVLPSARGTKKKRLRVSLRVQEGVRNATGKGKLCTQLKAVGEWGQHDKMRTQEKQISRIPKLKVPWVQQCRI